MAATPAAPPASALSSAAAPPSPPPPGRVAPGVAGPRPPHPTAPSDRALRRLRLVQRRIARAGPPSEAEVARMLAEFQARGGRVTHCPPAHAVAVNNGAGRDAARWTV